MVVNNANPKKKVEVLLMGQRFTVRSDRDEKYIDQLSRVVNDQLDDIRRNTRTISSHHVALLAALNIADELSRTKEALAKAEARLSLEKSEFDEMRADLANKAKATLQEVESALAFLPAEWRAKDEQGDAGSESGATSPHTAQVFGS